MVFKNYYKILELDTNKVTLDQIKLAYRKAAKKYHPDLNMGDNLAEDKIKDINEAYKILSVPSSKRKYDRIWNSHVGNRKTITYRNQKSSEFIKNIFFGSPEENKASQENILPLKGENIETEINASIDEAFYGLEKKISLKNNQGKLKTISVTIPEGIRDGEKIRLIGLGKKGKNGGKNGDLLIKINIENNNQFKLKGSDLYTDLLLTPWEAALGTRVVIKTIDDETKVYIPQGIQSGEKIRIQSKGYKINKEKRGDLIAEVKVMVPKNLTIEEKEKFEELNNISKFNPRTE